MSLNRATFKTLFLALGFFALSPFCYAQEENDSSAQELKNLKERIQRLEQELQKRPTAEQTAPQEEVIQKVTVGGKLTRPSNLNVRIGGYFSIVFHDEEGSTNHFDQHRFVPQVGIDITDKVHFDTEVEIEGGGADVGFLSGNEILVEFAELSFDISKSFIPKAGLILIPFGRYNLIHDDPLHDLFDRPFVARRISPSAFDQAGIGASGDFSFGAGIFHYDLALTQGFDDGFSNNGGSRDSRQSFRADNNNNKALWQRSSFRPNLSDSNASLEAGASLTWQKVDDDNEDTLIGWGFDLSGSLAFNETKSIALHFEGEYLRIGIDRDDPTLIDGLYGYYLQSTLRFRPWDDRSLNGWLRNSGYIGLSLRWEENNLNDNILGAATRDDREALTAGIAFRPFFKTVIRAEWKFTQSSGVATDAGDRFVMSISTYF